MKKKKLIPMILALTVSVSGGAALLTGCTPTEGTQPGQNQQDNYDVTFYGEDRTTVVSVLTAVGGSIALNDIEKIEFASMMPKPGYTLTWVDAAGVALDNSKKMDKAYYAKYTANTNTKYKVEHYFENLEGKYEIDATKTENLTGTTDTTVTATAKNEAHYVQAENANAVLSGTVKGDETLVLKVYYARERITVNFMADGEKLDSAEVMYGSKVAETDKEVPSKDKTPEKEWAFIHWSATENGAPYNFDAAVEAPLTLYAVYKETDRTYVLDVALSNDLYYLTDEYKVEWEMVEDYNFKKIDVGTVFSFYIELFPDSNGTPVVKAIMTNDDGTASTETLAPSADGLYSVEIKANTEIVIEGITAREYTVTVDLIEQQYNNEWAKVYKLNEVAAEVTSRMGGEPKTYENAVKDGKLQLALTAGVYDVKAFMWNNNDKVYLSGTVAVDVNSNSAPEGTLAVADALVLSTPISLEYGNATVNAEGALTSEDGSSWRANFLNFAPGAADFAVTVTYDQIMDDVNKQPHDTAALADPSIGFRFIDDQDNSIELPLYDAGSIRVWENGQMTVQHRCTMASAGSLLGKLEWPDCFRHAQLTYVKSNGWLYVLVNANGEAGGINTSGQKIGSTAETFVDFMPVMVDLTTGTVYGGTSLAKNDPSSPNGQYLIYQSQLIADVFKNVKTVQFEAAYGQEKGYYDTTGYGYTTDATVLANYEKMLRTELTIAAPEGLTVKVNGDAYTEKQVLKIGDVKEITFEVPAGKRLVEFSENGQPVAYAMNGKAVSYGITAYKNYGPKALKIVLEDGEYTESTTFTGKLTIDAKFTGYDLANGIVRFISPEGEVVKATYDATTQTYTANVKKGVWTLYASNGYLMGKTLNVQSGIGATKQLDVVLNDYAMADNEDIASGLKYANGKLTLNNQWAQQEKAFGNVTFKPGEEILEMGWTLTGLQAGSYNGHYPFMGMFLKDANGGMMRLHWMNAGDELCLSAKEDYLSRMAMTEIAGNGEGGVQGWMPFGTASNWYTWNADTEQAQNGTYKLTVKVRIDGYKLSVWFKTSKNDQWAQVTWDYFNNGTEFNIYDFMNKETSVAMRVPRDKHANDLSYTRKGHLDSLYKLDQNCQFGISARLDEHDDGINDKATFSDMWYNVIKK